jgi:hypothetical protein
MSTSEDDRPSPVASPPLGAKHVDSAVGAETSRIAHLTYISDYALRYCTVVAFGKRLSDANGKIAGAGTGTLLQIGTRRFIVTNDHVLAAYEGFRQNQPDASFRVGRESFDPRERLIARDGIKDLCTIDASGLDLNDRLATDSVPPLEFFKAVAWPPATPQQDERLFWAGFPKSLREDREGTIFHGPLTLTGSIVTRVDGDFIVCNLDPDRKDWIVHFADGLDSQSPELRTLGGMSGGPAFVAPASSLRPELVGIIYEYNATVNQMRLTRVEAIQPDGTIRRGTQS